MSQPTPQERLLSLLIENPDYARAYHDSAVFHSVVDAMVALAPRLLRQAYEESLAEAELRASAIAALKAEQRKTSYLAGP